MEALQIPLIGVNLGTLGYLCELEEATVFHAIDCLMQDDCIMEERIVLTGEKIGGNGAHMALNDVVIHWSGDLSMLLLNVYVNLSLIHILILDEATSSIDVQTEKALQTGLNRMLKGRTSFIIAHRLSTIRGCDKIMYIDDGGIAEAGTHEELMKKKGRYYKLYTAQKSLH